MLCVAARLALQGASSARPLLPSLRSRALVRHVELLSGTGSRLVVLEAAVVTTAKEELLNDGRRREGWFIAAQAGLMPHITKRDDTMRALSRTWTPAAKEAVSRA